MIPLSPASTLTRSPTFVAEEWAKYFDKGRVDQVVGGWRGVLYANLAIIVSFPLLLLFFLFLLRVPFLFFQLCSGVDWVNT